MVRTRMTMSGAMTFVGLATFWLAALRSGSEGWFRATPGQMLLTLIIARIWLKANGRTGSFWVGFALFGWCYLLLVTSSLGAVAFGNALPGSFSQVERLEVVATRSGSKPMMPAAVPAIRPYFLALWAGHFLATLIVATVGGFLAARLERSSAARDAEVCDQDIRLEPAC